jgi:hypothetical protein
MKRTIALTVFLLALAAAYIGCGGGGGPHGGPGGGGGGGGTSAAAFSFRGAPIFQHITSGHTVAGIQWPWTSTVQAATLTPVTNVGNYQGFCDTVPDATTTVIYGLGRWSNADCANNTQTFSNDGAPVISLTEIGNVVVLGRGGISPTDGRVDVYVNGTFAFSCTLGQSTLQRCADVVVGVVDNDQVTATVTAEAGSNLHSVRVLIGGQ